MHPEDAEVLFNGSRGYPGITAVLLPRYPGIRAMLLLRYPGISVMRLPAIPG